MRCFPIILLCVSCTASSGEEFSSPPKNNTYHTAWGGPYECHTNYECDLNHKYTMEPGEGRWKNLHRSFISEELPDGTELHYELPFIDRNNCLITANGDVGFIGKESYSEGGIPQHEGHIVFRLKFHYDCPTGHKEVLLLKRFQYWNFCAPGFLCGMDLYENFNNEPVGGALYDIEEDLFFFIKMPGFFGALYFNERSSIGACAYPQYHCYSDFNCSELIADCVNSEEECLYVGGNSFSKHKYQHKFEYATCLEVN